jgi:hypothetical protein
MHKILAFVACGLVAACGGGGGGGGGGGSSSGGGSTPMDIGGIYNGSVTENGQSLALQGIITADGNAQFVESGSGPVAMVSPNAAVQTTTGSYSSGPDAAIYALNGTTLDNGMGNEAVSISATFVSQQSISGTFKDSVASGTFTLSFDGSYYNMPVSVPLIAGTYTCSSGCGTVSIADDGTMIMTTSSGNTSYNFSGTITVPDSNHNGFDVQLSATNSSLPPYTGVAIFVPVAFSTVSKPQVVLALNTVNTGLYAVLTLQTAPP